MTTTSRRDLAYGEIEFTEFPRVNKGIPDRDMWDSIQGFDHICIEFITSQLNNLPTIKDSKRLYGKCTLNLFNWKQL